MILEQWVEVRIRNGQTITELTPSNAALRKKAGSMDPKPELVYRRLHFPEGVPPEYNWTGPAENARKYGGGGIQRLWFETWLEVSKREEQRPGSHIGPTGEGNLPRPQEHGGCECPLCRANARRLSTG